MSRIDLRGLGFSRTLTLINSRRVVPGGQGAFNSVDLNTIPLAVVERIEILKDGASAIYGSDALGGVVNTITRSEYSGTQVALYSGTSGHGDGSTYDLSVVTGYTTPNRNGHVLLSAGVQNQRPVWASDRSFSAFDRSYDFANHTEVRGGSPVTPGGVVNTLQIDTNHGRADRGLRPDEYPRVRRLDQPGGGGLRVLHRPADRVQRPEDRARPARGHTFDVLHEAGNHDGGARPHLRGNFTSLWFHPSGANAGVNGRLVGSFKECAGDDCNGGGIAHTVPSWYKLDVFAGFALKSKAGTTSVTVGANNVLDRAPPAVYAGTQSDSDAPTYDYMGRFYYVRMSQQF